MHRTHSFDNRVLHMGHVIESAKLRKRQVEWKQCPHSVVQEFVVPTSSIQIGHSLVCDDISV
jgi:hypothetical protein